MYDPTKNISSKEIYRPSNFNNNSLRAFYFFLFAWVIISFRIFLEFSISNMSNHYFLYFHHLFWFFSIFLMYMVFFRYIIKVKPYNILRFLLITPILLIPIIVYFLHGDEVMHMNYLAPHTIYTYFYHILTFMFYHSDNYFMGPELLTLFIGTAILSYYISRNILKSFYTTISTYLTLMILHATVIIGPDTSKDTLFNFKNTMDHQLAFASIYLTIIFLYLFILFYNEIKVYFFPIIITYKSILATIFIFLVFYSCLLSFPPLRYGEPPTTADMIVLSIHPFIYSFLFIALQGKFLSVKLFLLIMTGMSLALVIALFTPLNMKKITFDTPQYDVVIIGLKNDTSVTS